MDRLGRDDAALRLRLARALLWIVPAVWSSNYLIARASGPFVPPHLLAFGRWAIVFAVLAVLAARTLRAAPGRWRAEWKQSVVLGALGMWICGAWVYIGGRSTSATNIGLIYAAAPVGIAIGSQRLLGERLTGAQRVAMALALAGVLFVVLQGDPRALRSIRFTAGDLWIVAATAAWIAYSLLLRAWPSRLSATERLCCICAGGLLVLLPFVAWECLAQPVALGWQGAALIVLAGLLPGLFSYLAYAFMQQELGAARAALVMYLAPVYGAGLAWWLLDEPPRWYHAVAALMILPSIHIATRVPRAPATG
ncbi:MAG TPA: DMT family transporter [Albitalea sp.]